MARLECCPVLYVYQKVVGLPPSQVMCPGCGFSPGQSTYGRQPRDVSQCFCFFFSLSNQFKKRYIPWVRIKTFFKKMFLAFCVFLINMNFSQYIKFHKKIFGILKLELPWILYMLIWGKNLCLCNIGCSHPTVWYELFCRVF